MASGLKQKEEDVRIATFLHIAGDEAQEKYDSFIWVQEDHKNIMEEVLKKFDEDCAERTNIIAERFKFLSREQKEGENCDQFATALRSLVISCQYDKPEEALRDQFVLKIRDERAQEKLLDEAQKNAQSLSFNRAVNLVKNMEATKKQKHQMVNKTDCVNK